MASGAKSVWLSLCVALAFAAPAAAAEFAPAPAYNTAIDYRLGSGDKVKVTVFGEADLGGDFQVDAMGYIRMPMIGQVKAGGYTAHDVENSIRAALADGYLNDPRVAVEITAYRPFYIVGEVQ